MTNYEWIKSHTLIELIKNTLEDVAMEELYADTAAKVELCLDLLAERRESVQFPENSGSNL